MRIGLCLSGGGARGAFHMGVLKAFDEHSIKISVLSGCSAGALVGSLYAAGVKPESMISLAVSTRWFDFLKPKLPDKGLMGMEYLEIVLKKHIPIDDFNSLEIPIRVVATNVSKGIIRVFDHGPLIDAILASCSIPLLFKPIVIDEELYLDGGILLNLPATTIKDACDFLIGVNLLPLVPVKLDAVDTSFKLMNRVLELSVHNSSKFQIRQCDLLIESPEIASFSRYDLTSAEYLFQLGYLNCLQNIDAILEVSNN